MALSEQHWAQSLRVGSPTCMPPPAQQETVLALLRHPEYCEYGVSASKGVRGLDAAEERFNEVTPPPRDPNRNCCPCTTNDNWPRIARTGDGMPACRRPVSATVFTAVTLAALECPSIAYLRPVLSFPGTSNVIERAFWESLGQQR